MSQMVCLRRKLLKEVVLLAESEGSEVTEDIATPYAETLLQPDQVYFRWYIPLYICFRQQGNAQTMLSFPVGVRVE